MRTIQIRLVVAFASVFIANLALAGSLNLNDVYNAGAPFEGQDYMYSSVVESNTNGAGGSAINYFQNPQVPGDSFTLDPHDLRVDVTPGPGMSTLSSQLVSPGVSGCGSGSKAARVISTDCATGPGLSAPSTVLKRQMS